MASVLEDAILILIERTSSNKAAKVNGRVTTSLDGL